MNYNGFLSKVIGIQKMNLIIYFDTKYDQCVCFRNGTELFESKLVIAGLINDRHQQKYNYDTQCTNVGSLSSQMTHDELESV